MKYLMPFIALQLATHNNIKLVINNDILYVK